MKCYKSPEWFQVTKPTLGIGKSVPGTARRGPDVKHVEVNYFFPVVCSGHKVVRFHGTEKIYFMEQTCIKEHNSFLKYVCLLSDGF